MRIAGYSGLREKGSKQMEQAEKQQAKNKEQQVSFATTLRKVLELEKLVQRDIEALRKEAVGWYGEGK
jgi:uncharacterized protein YcaQ